MVSASSQTSLDLAASQFLVADCLIEPNLRRISRDGKATRVEPKVMQVLVCLAMRAGEVVTTDELLNQVWPNTFLSDQVLKHVVWQLRKALGAPELVETVPKRGYRLTVPIREATDANPTREAGVLPPTLSPRRRWVLISAMGLILLGFLFGATLFSSRAPLITEKDTVLISDFENKTGEAVFDGTLKEGLAAQLSQSSSLNIVSDDQVKETLRLMKRRKEQRLLGGVAREVCARQNAKAMVAGTITPLGTHYAVTLHALTCSTGETLSTVQTEAAGKENVLSALGSAATMLRQKLGESRASLDRFNTPLERATTPSLDALKQFTVGNEMLNAGRFAEAMECYNRAAEIDPNFVSAYMQIGWVHINQADNESARQFVAKAYELRDRVSERERMIITGRYYEIVLGDLDKATETYDACLRSFPRDLTCLNRKGVVQQYFGRFEEAEKTYRRGLGLAHVGMFNFNLTRAYRHLNRLDEAKAVLHREMDDGMDDESLRQDLYEIALLQNDEPEIERQLDWFRYGHREASLQPLSIAIAGYTGQWRAARKLRARLVENWKLRSDFRKAAASLRRLALNAAFVDDCRQARTALAEALALYEASANDPPTAYVLARCGDTARARQFANQLAKERPQDSMVNELIVPNILAVIELQSGNADGALELLRKCERFEAGDVLGWWIKFLPTHTRGMAYLRKKAGKKAAAEFEKIAANRNLDPFSLLHSLSFLHLGRAYALSGETEKARVAYQRFLDTWKDADSDIVIYRAARKEYAMLR